jgi:hypothetical protein
MDWKAGTLESTMAPVTTKSETPAALIIASSSVPLNELTSVLTTSGSPSFGVTASCISNPGVPGTMNPAGAECLTWKMGLPVSRNFARILEVFSTALSGSESGKFPPGK